MMQERVGGGRGDVSRVGAVDGLRVGLGWVYRGG